jgi:outer membrane protein
VRTSFCAVAAALAAIGFLNAPARAAESLDDAMVSAYSNNPGLNAARASLRATDEAVPQALSNFRPALGGSANASRQEVNGGNPTQQRGVSVTVDQTVFNGFRNLNALKSAETAVLSGRESLRNTEQTTLLNAATAFMNLVQAQATLNLRNNNIQFLTQQVKAAEDRLNVGTGTKTDVASANASLAAAQTQYYQAVSALNTAIAVYEQVIGHKPSSLGAARSVDILLPKTLEAALAAGFAQHPTIKSAEYAVDTADFAVKSAEGALVPTVTVNGTISRAINNTGQTTDTASLRANLTIPIWSGGVQSSRVRAAKETLGQRRIELDAARESVRQSVTSAWGALDAARASIRAADSQVAAQQLVLQGFMEQLKVGQATTLDVLNAQQTLLNAQLSQVTGQHDRVVAAYTLLGAIGLLSADYLSLHVDPYDPTLHYDLVRDKLAGTKTPDGR